MVHNVTKRMEEHSMLYKIAWSLDKKYDPEQLVHTGPILRKIVDGDYVPRTRLEADELCERANAEFKRGSHWVVEDSKSDFKKEMSKLFEIE